MELLYYDPKNTKTAAKVLQDLEIMISHVPQGLATFIVGDIDMSLSTQSSRPLHNLMRYYGFPPTVQEVTHRQVNF